MSRQRSPLRATPRPVPAPYPLSFCWVLLLCYPPKEIVAADSVQQLRVVLLHMSTNLFDDFIVGVASRHEPTLAVDDLRHCLFSFLGSHCCTATVLPLCRRNVVEAVRRQDPGVRPIGDRGRRREAGAVSAGPAGPGAVCISRCESDARRILRRADNRLVAWDCARPRRSNASKSCVQSAASPGLGVERTRSWISPGAWKWSAYRPRTGACRHPPSRNGSREREVVRGVGSLHGCSLHGATGVSPGGGRALDRRA